jgi:predicted ATPase
MANACAADYVDGVWFVDLAPITDPRLVSQAVALVVGVADQAAERMLGAVQSFIRNRRALLILDNCEHLLRSCAEVVGGLLRACAQLKVLATSREPLHLQGEAIFSLPALSCLIWIPSSRSMPSPSTTRCGCWWNVRQRCSRISN